MFEPSPEQLLLQTSVRRVFDTARKEGGDPWPQLVRMGLTAMTTTGPAGGSEASVLDCVLVMEEAGRALADESLLACFLAGWAVGDDPLAEDLAQELARGAVVTACGGQDVSIRSAQEQWRISGSTPWVPAARDATMMVASVNAPQGQLVALVDSSVGGVVSRPMGALDQTRSFHRVDFDDVTTRATARPRSTREGAALRALSVAADAVGGAQAALDSAVSYACEREQFATPIGAFQAVKHQLVDAFVAVESARAALYYAAWAIEAGARDAAVSWRVAKALACDAYTLTARTCLQTHGGIGFTEELPVHLHVKRALLDAHLYGSPQAHRAAIVEQLLAGEIAGPDW